MSITVVDLNEEVKKEAPALEVIEEATEPIVDTANEVIEEATKTTGEATEQPPRSAGAQSATPQSAGAQGALPQEEPKPKPKAKPKASDIVKCDKCDKSMSYKNLRYSQNCDPKPVKKQANPKPKAKQPPKPHEVVSKQRTPPQVYYSDSSSEEEVIVRRKKEKQLSQSESSYGQSPKQPLSPPNPVRDITNHYQLLHQQMLQQKQERYNNLCKNIFAPRVKKR